MTSFFKKLSDTADTAFSYVAHGESPAARLEKEHIIDRLMKRSLKVYTQTKLPGDSRLRYAERLHAALKGAHTASLEILLERNVVICLDPRLQQQATQKHGKWMQAVYAPARPGEWMPAPVLMLRDDGKMAREVSFFSMTHDLYTTAPALIDKLAGSLKSRKETDTPLVAGFYAHGRFSTLEWRNEKDFGSDTPARNPDLLKPPAGNFWPQPPKGCKPA